MPQPACYAYTKIQSNPICECNFSEICKRNFQNPSDSYCTSILENRGWVKTQHHSLVTGRTMCNFFFTNMTSFVIQEVCADAA